MIHFDKEIVIRGFEKDAVSDYSEKQAECVLIDNGTDLRDCLVTLPELQNLIRMRARLTEKNGEAASVGHERRV